MAHPHRVRPPTQSIGFRDECLSPSHHFSPEGQNQISGKPRGIQSGLKHRRFNPSLPVHRQPYLLDTRPRPGEPAIPQACSRPVHILCLVGQRALMHVDPRYFAALSSEEQRITGPTRMTAGELHQSNFQRVRSIGAFCPILETVRIPKPFSLRFTLTLIQTVELDGSSA